MKRARWTSPLGPEKSLSRSSQGADGSGGRDPGVGAGFGSGKDLQIAAVAIDHDDSGPQRRHQRGMAGEDAEIALGAGQVDLADIAGEQELLGRHEIEMEICHGLIGRMANGE